MYQHCIFCSRGLGANHVIETFQVGRSLAFDEWKGRLWAVCPRCLRWNLAPLEERWEAVEEAAKRFRDCRVRAHSENVGLAKLPDGTRLIRVGDAVPLELATWRYGDAIRRNRRRAIAGTAATLLGGTAILIAGAPLLAMGALPAAAGYLATQMAGNWLLMRQATRPVLRIPADRSPTGERLVLRQQTTYRARVVRASSGEGLAVQVPGALPLQRVESGRLIRWVAPEPLLLEGELANRFLERALVTTNLWSAGKGRLERAVQRLDAAGGPDRLLRTLSDRGGGLYPLWISANSAATGDIRGGLKRLAGSFRGELIEGRSARPAPPLPRDELLALEMALHEEAERRALEGELAALQAAWREAEEIAAIADALPDDPLDTLRTS